MELLGGVHREATHEAADAGDRFAAQQCLLCQVRGASELESTHIHTSYLLDMIKRRSSVLVINVSTDCCFFKNVISVCLIVSYYISYVLCVNVCFGGGCGQHGDLLFSTDILSSSRRKRPFNTGLTLYRAE